MREITNMRMIPYDLVPCTRRVIWCHKMIFRSSPIVVIHVPERQQGQSYADATAAVRELTEFGLRVVIDGSPNAISPELEITERQVIHYVDMMNKEMIESIDQLANVVQFLKRYGLHDAVWKVLGGNPTRYLQLKRIFDMNEQGAEKATIEGVKKYLLSNLESARTKNVYRCPENTKSIIKMFRQKKGLPLYITELEKGGILVDYPNKVFREIHEGSYVAPVRPAVGLIISENIDTTDDAVRFLASLYSTIPDTK